METGDGDDDQAGTQAGRPLFAFLIRQGAATALTEFAEVGTAPEDGALLWVHLDLSDPASQDWLHGLPYSPDILETVAAPAERGRLHLEEGAIYGYLRDFRGDLEEGRMRGGTLNALVDAGLFVTGQRAPLRAVEELRRRVQHGAVSPRGAFQLLTEFFAALNDIGEDLLDDSSARLSELQEDILELGATEHQETLFRMRRDAYAIVRDMSFKRATLHEFLGEQLKHVAREDKRRLRVQTERYAALVEDAQDYAQHCHFLLEEGRAQIAEETNRSVRLLTILSATFLPATLLTGMWGMNVANIPFTNAAANGFWDVAGLIGVALVLIILAMRGLRIL